MPLQATSGAASYDAFGGGAAAVPNYIEDVFQTWLYSGNGSTQTITTGIDLSTKGGMIWQKPRTTDSYNNDHKVFDTARGQNNVIYPNLTSVEDSGRPLSYTASGFTLNAGSLFYGLNESAKTYASWTFRKQPKFFDVVTWTGDASGNRTLSHALTSTPACIIIKATNATDDWYVYHTSLGTNKWLYLNTTSAEQSGSIVTAVSSTTFTVSQSNGFNTSGRTYVAYLFAHDAGGFGLTGTDNVISCGSYTGNGSTDGPVIDLGYEPQWLLIKSSSAASTAWMLVDNMRGMTVGGADAYLKPNSSDAETTSLDLLSSTATGFKLTSTLSSVNGANDYIYIAIRRGPMKVPTSGTSVYGIEATNGSAAQIVATASYPSDLFVCRARDAGYNNWFTSRLTNNLLASNSTDAEVSNTYWKFDVNAGTKLLDQFNNGIFYNFSRAPNFFDVVCYTGTGSTTTFNHNLGVAPELMLIKSRSDALGWRVYAASAGNTGYLVLNANDAFGTSSATWNNTSPTSSVFTVGTTGAVNSSGSTFVAYLFASVSGVSKVGSYTGTGATQTINCGFTGGARFVMVKRTDNLGSWWVWDTARGMVSGTDPRLALNSTSAETNADWVYTTSTGFQVVSTNSEVNASGGTYIYLAIA